MAIIFLVRHGESEANVKGILSDSLEGYPLTEKGKEEIGSIVLQLNKLRFDRIISSPVLRARQSAALVSKSLGIPVEQDGRLRESSMGVYNNMPYFALPEGRRQAKGLEPWESIEERMVNFSMEQKRMIIAVSHQINIRVLLAHFLDLGEPESYGLDISRASISAIDTARNKVLTIGSMKIGHNLVSKLMCERN